MEFSLWELVQFSNIQAQATCSEKQMKSNTEQSIQSKVWIHNHQMIKDLEIYSLEEYMHIFLIYILWNISQYFSPKQTEHTAQAMVHPPKWTDQMKQLVYCAMSVCSRLQ